MWIVEFRRWEGLELFAGRGVTNLLSKSRHVGVLADFSSMHAINPAEQLGVYQKPFDGEARQISSSNGSSGSA